MVNGAYIEMYGVVTKIISGKYMIELTNGLSIEGYISGKMKLHNIRVYEKDLVKVNLSPYDLHKGRIVFRLNPKKEEVVPELQHLCNKLNIILPKVKLLGE